MATKLRFDRDASRENRLSLEEYDYDFSQWPVAYTFNGENVPARRYLNNGVDDAFGEHNFKGYFGQIFSLKHWIITNFLSKHEYINACILHHTYFLVILPYSTI